MPSLKRLMNPKDYPGKTIAKDYDVTLVPAWFISWNYWGKNRGTGYISFDLMRQRHAELFDLLQNGKVNNICIEYRRPDERGYSWSEKL